MNTNHAKLQIGNTPTVDVRIFYDIIGLTGKEFSEILRGCRKTGNRALLLKLEARRTEYLEDIARQGRDNLTTDQIQTSNIEDIPNE